MTCRGYIRKGMIVLEKPVELPDGASVDVEVRPTTHPGVGSERIAKLAEGIDYDFEAADELRGD